MFTEIVFQLGALQITQSILTSLLILSVLSILSWLFTRSLSLEPSKLQIALEGIFIVMQDAIEDVLPEHVSLVFPYIATLWVFILCSNLMGVIPGFHSPTSDLSVTACLAFLTFCSVHYFGVRSEGLKNYLKHYVQPSPLLLPFHLISELSRTLALAIRLFGNMISLELTGLIVLMVAGFLAPIPILMLHIIEAIIQAYIFGMLALIYIAGGIQSQQYRQTKESIS